MTMKKIVIISGAGLSADSGISTFRGSDGTWENHDLDVVCNLNTWRRNYDKVHSFYNERRESLASVEPNSMHKLMAEFEKKFQVHHFTQNIDNLLERAGCTKVVHVHGFLTNMSCQNCGEIWDIGYNSFTIGDMCFNCGSKKDVKPDVVFFNENAPRYAYMWSKLSELTKDDILIIIGTSGVVLPINEIARVSKCRKILNNLDAGDITLDYFDKVMLGRASEMVHEMRHTVEEMMK